MIPERSAGILARDLSFTLIPFPTWNVKDSLITDALLPQHPPRAIFFRKEYEEKGDAFKIGRKRVKSKFDRKK